MKIKSLKLYDTGYCTHPEKIAYSKGSWKQICFPATVGLLQHPELGYILFDTGYAGHFKEATKNSLTLYICKTDACSFYGRAIY